MDPLKTFPTVFLVERGTDYEDSHIWGVGRTVEEALAMAKALMETTQASDDYVTIESVRAGFSGKAMKSMTVAHWQSSWPDLLPDKPTWLEEAVMPVEPVTPADIKPVWTRVL